MSAVLKITDGTNTVDLLGGSFYLANWRPAIAQYKNAGGTFVDSPLSEGRRIVYKQFANTIERFDLKQRGTDVDNAAEYMGQLLNLVQLASDYWLSEAIENPVYLMAKSSAETNIRYAVLVSGAMPDQENPFSMPFMQADCAVVQDNLTLVLERMHWQSDPPGEYSVLESTAAIIQDSIVSGGSFEGAGFANYWTEYNSPTTAETSLDRQHAGLQSAKIVASIGADKGIYQDIGGLEVGEDYTFYARALVDIGIGSLIAYDGGALTNPVRDDTPQRATELLSNTSFESGLSGWTSGNLTFTQSATYAYDGTKSARVEYDYDVPAAAVYSERVTLTTDGNANLDLVFAARVQAFEAEVCTYKVLFYDSSDSLIPTPDIIVSSAGTVGVYSGTAKIINIDAWRVYRATYMRPGNAVYARIFFNFVNTEFEGSGTYDMYIDDFSLMEVLPPTNYSDEWKSLSVTKTVPAGGSIRIAVAAKSTTGGTIYFDSIYSNRVIAGDGLEYSKAFFSNYQAEDNISHIFVYDGSYSTNLIDTDEPPYDILPLTPAANDAVYFGSSDAYEGHSPFASLLFDLGSIARWPFDDGSYTLQWEYRDSRGSWQLLYPQDGTNEFTASGRNAVIWQVPEYWDDDYSVNSVSGYWVRALISAYTADSTDLWVPAVQQNSDPHVIGYPFFEFDSAVLGGDLNTLVKYNMQLEGSPVKEQLVQQITTGVDDAHFLSPTVTTGGSFATVTTGVTLGLRFQNASVPQGAIIISAALRCRPDGSADNDAVTLRIHGHDHDNSGAWGSYAEMAGRTRTTAYVDKPINAWHWDLFGGTPGVADGSKWSLGIVTDIIQEIVNRPGFTDYTSAITLFLDANYVVGSGSRAFQMYEAAADSWQLRILYIDTNLYTTSMVMGSRRTDRGSNFRSHFNMISEQPQSISIALGNNAEFAKANTGAYGTYSFGVPVARNEIVRLTNLEGETGESPVDRATFRIHAPISGDFNGRFRAFIRAYHDSAVTNGTSFRLRVATGAGGVSHTGDVFLSRRAEIEAVDLGMVTIPEVGTIDYIELGIQASRTTSGTVLLFDLILIPIDEWAVEVASLAKNPLGMMDESTYLELDGITPVTGAEFMRAIVKRRSDDSVRAEFVHSGLRPALDNRATQRVYCLALSDLAIGSGVNQLINGSLSTAVHSVDSFGLARYLVMRGAR